MAYLVAVYSLELQDWLICPTRLQLEDSNISHRTLRCRNRNRTLPLPQQSCYHRKHLSILKFRINKKEIKKNHPRVDILAVSMTQMFRITGEAVFLFPFLNSVQNWWNIALTTVGKFGIIWSLSAGGRREHNVVT